MPDWLINYKLPKGGKEIWDDHKMKRLVDDPQKDESMRRVIQQKNLTKFGDKDKDKIPNVFDRKPYKKSKQFNIRNII